MSSSKTGFRMLKHSIGLASLIFSIAAYATNSVPKDSIPISSHKKNIGDALLDWVYAFNRCDTNYIRPHRYEYALLSEYSTHWEQYGLYGRNNNRQHTPLSLLPQRRVGLYFGWRFLFVGWSVDVDRLGFSRKSHNRRTTIDLSLYSAHLGLDLLYSRTSNADFTHRLSGVLGSSLPGSSLVFDGLSTDVRGIHLYYIFNSQRFSYPAIYGQTTNQRRNAGGFMMGISYFKHRFFEDENHFSPTIRPENPFSTRITQKTYTTTALYLGYGYNWVLNRHLAANLSFNPSIAYRKSSTDFASISNTSTTQRQHQWGVDLLGRAGIVYNHGRYFIGSSWVARVFNFRHDESLLRNSFGTLRLYIGVHLGTRKAHRNGL